jgi:hypothetical protein
MLNDGRYDRTPIVEIARDSSPFENSISVSSGSTD